MSSHEYNHVNNPQQPLLVPLGPTPRPSSTISAADSDHPSNSPQTITATLRAHLQYVLTSKAGHYSILLLVTLDVSCIFADFLLSLYVCENTCQGGKHDSDGGVSSAIAAQDALGAVSLAFSCLFMLELVASVWAFTPRKYFGSKFHVFDATVIIAGFVIDVCLHGMLEEIGSIVVVGRLWRVFKIIEELSASAEDQMDQLRDIIEERESENSKLRRDLEKERAKISEGAK